MIKDFRINSIKFVLASILCLIALGSTATALQSSDFKAGNIIDDAIFNNNSSMSAVQIQNFLNSKMPSCDTNGTKMYNSTQTRAQYGASAGNPAPYTCLKDYVQVTQNKPAETGLCSAYTGGTKTSAQIIADVSQACGINPQVLLVLLQKEQSLVTDDWPWDIQYRSATGFGCPDTAPCDADYYGFFNQVYHGARIYKKYARDASSFNYRMNRNNFIQYNPNSSCGGSTLFLSGQATAGLYNYTPYQPNTAALNNLYGSGDSCSAYGNRNFWRMFNDWFGNTNLPMIVKSPDSPAVYLHSNGFKFYVPSSEIASDFNIGGAQTIPSSTLNSIPSPGAGSGLSANLGTLVKSPSDSDDDGGSVYVISRGAKHSVISMDQFNNFGYRTEDITYLPLGYIYSVPSAGNLSNFIQLPNFTVFKVENGMKRHIVDNSTYNSINPSGSVARFSSESAAKIPSGPLLTNLNLVLKLNSGSYHLFANNKYHYIPTFDVLNCWGFTDTLNIPTYTPASDSYVSAISSTGVLRCGYNNGSNSFVLNKANRVRVPAEYGFTFPGTDPDLVTIADRLPARNAGLAKAVQATTSKAIWFLENGSRKLIPTMLDFERLGLSIENIDQLSPGAVSELNQQGIKLGIGRPVKSDDSNAVYIISSLDTKTVYASGDDYLAYGNEFSSILTLPSITLDTAYTTSASPVSKYLHNSQGAVYLMDPSGCYGLTDELLDRFGQSRTNSQPYPDNIFYKVNYVNCKNGSKYVRSQSHPTVYEVKDSKKYPVSSYSKLQSLSQSSSPYIIILSDSTLATLPTGETL